MYPAAGQYFAAGVFECVAQKIAQNPFNQYRVAVDHAAAGCLFQNDSLFLSQSLIFLQDVVNHAAEIKEYLMRFDAAGFKF